MILSFQFFIEVRDGYPYIAYRSGQRTGDGDTRLLQGYLVPFIDREYRPPVLPMAF